MKTFKQFIENRFNYLDIGHNLDGNYTCYYVEKDSDNIKICPERDDPEYFHDDLSYGNFDFKGRIDHDKKMISIVIGSGNEEKLDYIVYLLKDKFPNYKIYLFSYGIPRQL